jgi:hypothetical protein
VECFKSNVSIINSLSCHDTEIEFCVCMYKSKGIHSPDIPDSSADFTQVNPWY